MSNKVGKMIAIFSAVSVISACFMGWLNSDSSFEDEENGPYQGDDTGALVPQEEQRLLDDNGNGYTLFSNPYGSETASFDNGEQVTFSREEDGSLSFISGSAGLLAGMLASYYLFHGFNPPAGRWNQNTNRYTVSDTMKPLSDAERASAMKKYLPPNTQLNRPVAFHQQKEEPRGSGGSAGGGGIRSNGSSTDGKASSKSVGSVKSGFGGAGARGGAS